jgi:hypothetical protein
MFFRGAADFRNAVVFFASHHCHMPFIALAIGGGGRIWPDQPLSRTTMMRTLLMVAGLAIAAPATAQDATEQSSVIADQLLNCRSITEAQARLACFDANAATFAAAREANQIVVLDREEVRQAKRSLFGFSLPRIRLFGGDESNEPEVREIESTLASVQSAGGNRWALTLADNSRWQTTDASSTFFPRNGQDVKIEAGILGSYSAKIGSGRAVKVKRIQ